MTSVRITRVPSASQVVADREARVGQELMMAAGVTGIPCALVVDRHGIVRFCGHPADPAFEAAVRQVTRMQAGAMEGPVHAGLRDAFTLCVYAWMQAYGKVTKFTEQLWSRGSSAVQSWCSRPHP